MISPYGTLQEDAAAWLEDDDFLNDIIIVTEVRGNVQNRIDVALSQGAIHSQTPLAAIYSPTPTFSFVDYAGTTILNGAGYSYGLVFVTAQGESELSEVNLYSSAPESDKALQLNWPAPNARVLSVKIFRNDADGNDILKLLVEVDMPATYYQDHETHAQFSSRSTEYPTPPTVNTTAGYEKKPGIAIVVRTPSSHEFGDARARVSRDTTLRVEVYAKPVVNDSANGTGKNPLDVSWAVERRMLNWNRGSGTYSILFTAFDSEEVVKLGEIWYFNEFSVRHGVDLTQ